MTTKITTAFGQLPIGSKCLDISGGDPKIFMKISSIELEGVTLNCLDMDKGAIYHKDETDEVFWVNVG